jgi:hypothetical protein
LCEVANFVELQQIIPYVAMWWWSQPRDEHHSVGAALCALTIVKWQSEGQTAKHKDFLLTCSAKPVPLLQLLWNPLGHAVDEG